MRFEIRVKKILLFSYFLIMHFLENHYQNYLSIRGVGDLRLWPVAATVQVKEVSDHGKARQLDTKWWIEELDMLID